MFYQCFCLSELRPTYSTRRLDRTGRYHNESLDSLTIIILYGNFLNIVISIYSLIIVFVRLVMFIKRICYVMLYVFFCFVAYVFMELWCVCMCVWWVYQDIDECDGGLGKCGANVSATACKNGKGNYSCECQPGFVFDGTTCTGELIHAGLVHWVLQRSPFIISEFTEQWHMDSQWTISVFKKRLSGIKFDL